MEGRPVFASRSDADLWERARSLKGQNDPKAVASLVSRVSSRPAPVHSAILCETILRVAEAAPEGWADTAYDLAMKKRHEDFRPALEAASAFAAKGILDKANKVLAAAPGGSCASLYHLVRAEVQYAGGDVVGAVDSLKRSVTRDGADPRAYLLLSQLDPGGDWLSAEACERMSAGLDWSEPPQTKTAAYSLFQIYREWYSGKRDSAGQMLVSSSGYADRRPEFCLLSARMSRDEGDWISANKMYDLAVAGMQDSAVVLCERGRARLMAGDAESAMDSYRAAEALDQGSPAVMRGLIDCCLRLGRTGDAAELTRDFLRSEAATDADYSRSASEMIRIGRVDDASEIAGALLDSYPGDVAASIVLSKARVAEGDLAAAESAAKVAVRHDRKNPEALAQLSRVRLARGSASGALRAANRAVRADPDSIPALLALVEACSENGDTDGAEAACEAVLKQDPVNREAVEVLARIRLSRNDPDAKIPAVAGADDFVALLSGLVKDGRNADAVRLCDENESRFGSVPAVIRLRGNAEYAVGDYLKASAAFASAAALSPQDAAIWHSKGMADEMAGDLESAEGAYWRAVSIDTGNSEYWTSLGIARAGRGDNRGAMVAFNRAIELDPRSAYPLVRKAAVLANDSRYQEALSIMDVATATEPDSPTVAKARMRICLAAGRYNDVLMVGRSLKKRDRGDPETVSLMVRADIGIGDDASAKKLVEDSLSKDRGNVELLMVARDLAEHIGDSEGAIAICRAILKERPDDRRSKRMLADSLYASGRAEEAAMLYKDIDSGTGEGKDAPEGKAADSVASMGVARSLLEAGDLEGAAKMADRALAVDPDDPDYVLFRADVYRRREGAAMASAFLSKAIERIPSDPRLREAAGDAYTALEDPTSAAAAYSKAVDLGMSTSGIHLKRGEALEAMGDLHGASAAYSAASMIDPKNWDASARLASVSNRLRDPDGAVAAARRSVEAEPNASAYASMAEAYQAKKDRDGVTAAYQGFIRCQDATADQLEAVAVALGSVGLRKEASALRGIGSKDRGDEASPEVMRCAERLMRRAYMLDADVSDADLAAGMPDDPDLVSRAAEYLGDIPDYGDIVPGTMEQQRLEKLSLNAVSGGKVKDVEAMTVDAAFVAGRAKDAEEAKTLVAYMRAASTARLPREPPKELVEKAMSADPDDGLEDVMREFGIGVYSARVVKLLAVGSRSSRTS